jgi:hypothetical protein
MAEDTFNGDGSGGGSGKREVSLFISSSSSLSSPINLEDVRLDSIPP